MKNLQEIANEKNQKLNKIEELKLTKTPLEVFEKMKEYAKSGYESIPEDEKSFFLKCFGIFDRESTPGMFMMRIRTSGGYLSIKQAEVLGYVAQKYGNDYIDLTTRAAIELRYLKIEDIPTILEELESVGLTSFQTGVDNIRSIITDPLDGVSSDCLIDCAPIIKEMEALFLKDFDWIASLPRKFNTAITGCTENRCNVFGQDCAFVPARYEGRLGFSPFLGGRVGNFAKPSNLFLESHQVVPFYEALLKLFKKYGFRHNRNKNRLMFLIEEVGLETILSEIESELGVNFLKEPQILMLDKQTLEFITETKDGFALHCSIPGGVFSGSELLEAVEFAKDNGGCEIRLTVEQNFIITGLKSVPSESPLVKKYKQFDNSFLRNLVACAGKTHCPFGVIEAKDVGVEIAKNLAAKYPDKKEQIRFYWSCCPKGCGIHESGEFGFVGTKTKVGDETVEAVNIYKEGKLVKSGVPLDSLQNEIELECKNIVQ